METPQGYKEAGMQFALFNQLQMPKPWRENAEVLIYKEAITEAVHAEAVGFDAYWQTEHHFYTEIGHSSAPEIVLAALSQYASRLRLGLGGVDTLLLMLGSGNTTHEQVMRGLDILGAKVIPKFKEAAI